MPSFAKDLAHPEQNNVSVRELSLIVDWLRGDYYRADDPAPLLPHPRGRGRAGRARWPARRPTLDRRRRRAARRRRSENHSRPSGCSPPTAPPATATPTSHGRGIAAAQPSAPNLFGFGSPAVADRPARPEQIKSDKYFGNTRHADGDMVGFVNDNLAEPDDDAKAKLALDHRRALRRGRAARAGRGRQEGRGRRHARKGPQGAWPKRSRARPASIATSSAIRATSAARPTSPAGPRRTGSSGSSPTRRTKTSTATPTTACPASARTRPGPKQPLLSADEIDLVARWLRGELKRRTKSDCVAAAGRLA